MRRTRILVTLGPASTDPAAVRALIDAGADAFRLNFSHGTIADHQETTRRVRAAAAAAKRDIAVVQDLGGPKIRTGPLAAPFPLREGDTLIIEQGDFSGSPGRISCGFEALFTSVDAGARLLVDDGRIELEVEALAPQRLTTRVVTGGLLDAHKGINLPGVSVRTSALTLKDHEDLRAGVAMGVDMIALSFVQAADDVRAARAAAAAAGAADLPIIAKIEKPHAVEHIDEIVRVSEGLMVARGDLGIELPFEKLPAAQKRIIAAGRRHGVPVILATQVLDSMRTEPRPTRAEVTDAAHAVEESVDAIMLAAETSVGKYPVKSVEALDLIIREAEATLDPSAHLAPDRLAGADHARALCEAAVTLAERAKASAIVAITEGGNTARLLASMRPTARILAATAHPKTAARASLVWGVTPFVTNDTTHSALRDLLLARGLVPSGAAVVFIAMRHTLGSDETNYVHVERL